MFPAERGYSGKGNDDKNYALHAKGLCSGDEYNQNLFLLGQIGHEIADANGATWIDVHGPVKDAMLKAKQRFGEAYPYAGDGVHPDRAGHFLIAYAFLKAWGFDGDLGTIEYSTANNSAIAHVGHRVVRSAQGIIHIESVTLPFSFVDALGSEPLRYFRSCVPFDDELNRFIFKVPDATRALAISWGEEKKVFEAGELRRGINLAAEFSLHPLTLAFQKVFDSGTKPAPTLHSLKVEFIQPPS